MKMTKNKDLNIKPLFYIRFLFGYYHNLQSSRRIQLLGKSYCVSVIICMCCMLWDSGDKTWYSMLSMIGYYVQYVTGIVISFYTKDKYLFDMFRAVTIINSAPSSTHLLNKLKKLLAFTFIIFIILWILNVTFAGIYIGYHRENQLKIIFIYLFWLILDVGRWPFIFVFAVLFYRLKVLRLTLETIGFDNAPSNRFTPKKYIQMYEMVLNGLHSVETPTKLMMSVYLMCTVPKSLYEYYLWMSNIRNQKLAQIGYVPWFMVNLLQTYVFVIIPVVILDLMSDDIRQIKITVLEKRFTCTNERARSEVQGLLDFLENQPLEFTLFRVIPLNLRLILGFSSFCATTIIAIMQIKSFST